MSIILKKNTLNQVFISKNTKIITDVLKKLNKKLRKSKYYKLEKLA